MSTETGIVNTSILLLCSLFLSVIFSVILAGCQGRGTRLVQTQAVFKPPIQSPTVNIVSRDSQSAGQATLSGEDHPTPTPACINNLLFLDDLTIPDGTVVDPGQRLDKRWQVQNNGSCSWDVNYSIKLIAGPGMGVPVQQALIPARSGTEAVIRMVYIAPDEPGNYRSAWQAFDPQGLPFGDPFFIDIIVDDLSDSTEIQ